MTILRLILAILWPLGARAGDFISPELEKTKLAALALYTEANCPDLKGDLSAIARMDNGRVNPRDWGPGGRLNGLLEAELQSLFAERGSKHNRIFCLAMEAAHPTELKRR
jgi:hypothetical protein